MKEHLQVLVLFAIFIVLVEWLIALHSMWLIASLVICVIDQKYYEEEYECPAQKIIDQAEEWNTELDLCVELRNHCHLAALMFFTWLGVLKVTFAKSTCHILCTLFRSCFLFKSLISECHIYWCYWHQLHTKSKHHKNNKNWDDT